MARWESKSGSSLLTFRNSASLAAVSRGSVETAWLSPVRRLSMLPTWSSICSASMRASLMACVIAVA